MAGRVGSIYGNALFSLALEEDRLDDFLAQAEALRTIFSENEELSALLRHPELSREEKLSLVKNIFSGRASEEMVGFLFLVVEKGRSPEIPEILDDFLKRAKRHKGIGTVQVLSAVPLLEDQKERLVAKLLATTAYTSFVVDYQVEPALLGGLIVRLDNRVLDSSLRTQLAKMKKELSEIALP